MRGRRISSLRWRRRSFTAGGWAMTRKCSSLPSSTRRWIISKRALNASSTTRSKPSTNIACARCMDWRMISSARSRRVWDSISALPSLTSVRRASSEKRLSMRGWRRTHWMIISTPPSTIPNAIGSSVSKCQIYWTPSP